MDQKIRIKLKSFDHMLVDKSAEKIVKTVKSTGAKVSGPIPLPTFKRIYTVNRSTFVNKKSREQFELSAYKRLIDILQATPKTVDALTITDVTLQASAPVNTTTPSGMVFEGSYDNTTMSQYDFYLNNNNEIRYLNAESHAYPGLRSIIRTNGQYSPAATEAPVAMFLNYDDSDMDGATGIESVIAEEFGQNAILVTKSTKVYDLNGRVVANGADMMNNLPSGVYIVNGKKYVK